MKVWVFSDMSKSENDFSIFLKMKIEYLFYSFSSCFLIILIFLGKFVLLLPIHFARIARRVINLSFNVFLSLYFPRKDTETGIQVKRKYSIIAVNSGRGIGKTKQPAQACIFKLKLRSNGTWFCQVNEEWHCPNSQKHCYPTWGLREVCVCVCVCYTEG